MLEICITESADLAEKKLNNALDTFQDAIVDGSRLAGRSAQKRITTMLSTGQRTGRKYRGLRHRSSKLGEVPRSQSGRTMRSIYYHAGSPYQFSVGTTSSYAEHLAKLRQIKGEDWIKHILNLESQITEGYLRDTVAKALK